MSQHTRGPWTQSKKNGRIIVAGDKKIATAELQLDRPISWKNAALIAAAPELLECLLEVVEDGLKTNTKAWQSKAQAAIAKANQ